MDEFKVIVLKGIDGTDIEVKYRSVSSEYDSEQIDKVYLDSLTINENGKSVYKVDRSASDILRQRIEALINYFVTDVTGCEGQNKAEYLKKKVNRVEWQKLVTTLESVVEPVSEVEKKD